MTYGAYIFYIMYNLLQAEWNYNLDGLFQLLVDPSPRNNYEWIRQRIERTWPHWLLAAKNINFNATFRLRHRQQVSVYSTLFVYVEQCVWLCKDQDRQTNKSIEQSTLKRVDIVRVIKSEC